MTVVVVAGSRNIRLGDTWAALDCTPWEIDEVISGLSYGPDDHSLYWAARAGIPVRRRPADWKRNGKAAGPIRNRQMAQETERAIIIWDGESRGTANMVEEMEQQHKPYELYGPRASDTAIESARDDSFSD